MGEVRRNQSTETRDDPMMKRPSPNSLVQEVYEYFNGQLHALDRVYAIALRNGGDLKGAVKTVRGQSLDVRDGWFRYGFLDKMESIESL